MSADVTNAFLFKAKSLIMDYFAYAKTDIVLGLVLNLVQCPGCRFCKRSEKDVGVYLHCDYFKQNLNSVMIEQY